KAREAPYTSMCTGLCSIEAIMPLNISRAIWITIINGEGIENFMKTFTVTIFWIASCLPASAQQLSKVGEVSSLDNQVQALQSSLIVARNDITNCKENVYHFGSRKFGKPNEKLPPDLENWRSFNCNEVDFENQIDRNDFESDPLSTFVPAGSKVKAFG